MTAPAYVCDDCGNQVHLASIKDGRTACSSCDPLFKCNDANPCREDPDEPCPCRAHIGLAVPRVKIRYSNRAVRQVRALSGDRRWPLRSADDA